MAIIQNVNEKDKDDTSKLTSLIPIISISSIKINQNMIYFTDKTRSPEKVVSLLFKEQKMSRYWTKLPIGGLVYDLAVNDK